MQPEGSLLVALIPPGSVEAEMGKVQAGIFAEHGLASAQALPPLIPVAFIAAPPRGFLAQLERSVRAGWVARAAGSAWVEGCLFACVQTGGLWPALRTRARAAAGEGILRPFPEAEGFCLGCMDAAPGIRGRIAPAVPELSFSSCSIALLRFTSPRAAWWQEVYWDTLEERPLRGRRGA
jgi:hypothetical protein